MDIYSAINHVDRLLNFVKSIPRESVNKMYQPSKDKLKYVVKVCTEVASIISDLLQEEILTSEVPSSELNASEELRAYISQMELTVSNIQQLISVPESPEVLSSTLPSIPVADDKLSREAKHNIKVKFLSAFENLSNQEFCCSEATECAQLLWKWFNNRFKLGASTNFRYNIRRVPDWISAIVMLYSHSISTGTKTSFVASFQEWCNRLLYDADNLPYPLPYNVYQCDKSSDKKEYLTLTYVVLWDILWDSGLDSLDAKNSPEVFLSPDTAYELCGNERPELLDNYVNYTVDGTILSKCNLVGGEPCD